MSTRKIIHAFEQWCAEQRCMVLATVCRTEGSTYSKAGHRILIADTGDYQGLISGGCLEGDLAEHAAKVIADGQARRVTYDMRDDADELWGLGIGCNGLLEILLQRLDQTSNYEPFRTLSTCIQGRSPVIAATLVDANSKTVPIGATFVLSSGGEQLLPSRLPAPLAATVKEHCLEFEQGVSARLITHQQADGDMTVLYTRVLPLPRMLVLGAGLDAIPVINIADELGWGITVMDHREAYLEKAGLDERTNAFLIDPEKLHLETDLSQYSAAIIMSHHLATDMTYLRQLAPSSIPYVGILGPRIRRDRLIEDLSDENLAGLDRIKGPVGLDIGANSPESIALSILAEIHALLACGNFATGNR